MYPLGPSWLYKNILEWVNGTYCLRYMAELPQRLRQSSLSAYECFIPSQWTRSWPIRALKWMERVGYIQSANLRFGDCGFSSNLVSMLATWCSWWYSRPSEAWKMRWNWGKTKRCCDSPISTSLLITWATVNDNILPDSITLNEHW